MRLDQVSIGVTLAALIATPLAAQDHRFQVYGHAGAVTPLANLQQTSYPSGGSQVFRHFSGGVQFGAGVFLWLDDNLGLRGEGTYAGAKVSSPESNASWSKIFLGGDIVLRSAAYGLAPFGYFGFGIARLDESGSRTDAIGVIPTATRPAGRFGGGLNFTPEGGVLGFFAEASLLVYDFNQTRFPFYDKVQTDVAWKGGISFRF